MMEVLADYPNRRCFPVTFPATYQQGMNRNQQKLELVVFVLVIFYHCSTDRHSFIVIQCMEFLLPPPPFAGQWNLPWIKQI